MCWSFIYEGDRALQVGLCHHSNVLYSWQVKESYLELAQLDAFRLLTTGATVLGVPGRLFTTWESALEGRGKWNESGFRPPLCTYRLNWARRTSWGWWDDWDDTVLQTQDSTFEPWRSEAEHATSRSRRLPTILTFTRGWGRNIFVSFKPPRPGTEPRTLAWKAAVLTTTLGGAREVGNIGRNSAWEVRNFDNMNNSIAGANEAVNNRSNTIGWTREAVNNKRNSIGDQDK